MKPNEIFDGYQEIHDEYDSLIDEHLELVKKEIHKALIDMGLKYYIARTLLGERASNGKNP